MIELTGYQILDRIYSGTRTLVYRGTRLCDQTPVIIKILRSEYPSFSELVQFRNQYTIAKNLNFPGIIETYSLEAHQNSYALVMEDFGGISLKEGTQKGETAPTLMEFLQVAIALCNTLNVLYRHRIIHKDIKPANILINPQTKQVKLIDFSIASLLPRETQILMSPNVLEGTLGYLSPEQTGRMNRGIDYRSDFYSLGVTFYELLAGELPFQSHDAMELVHSHIAKEPPSLHDINPQIPPVLSEIVSKLMAKNAEDRYQSALGLKFDLELCLRQLEESGIIQGFAIARRDVCDRFIIPEKLYGREAEVAELLAAFDRISGSKTLTGGNQSKRELMLVAGFSGIGKTAIVNEVHKPIVGARGYFIKGKFDQFNRNIPFSAFVQAFRELMGQLLSESDAQLAAWKTKILAALGDSAQVIIDVIPELEQIIDSQPTATELSGTAAQNRFNLLWQKFLQVFTTKEHPLVIFLDDLQWADSASLKLMQLLMSESDGGYLLLIGADRDREVSAAHPLMLALDEIRKIQATINTITLESLTETSLNQLVADTLSCTPPIALPLTKLISQKTKGNPFFSTQFLKLLHDDELIQFDLDGGNWHCALAKVKALALTDDVVEFMALQLQKLSAETQDVLKLAACIGAQFDLQTLGIVYEQSETETAVALWPLQEGLIIPINESYKFFQEGTESLETDQSIVVPYRFLHDRVQQAAYSLIPNNQKQSTHLKIGQLLQQNLSETEKQEKLFDLVGHLNLGKDLITQPREKEALAKLNLAAGRKARSATAYKASTLYLEAGIDLLTVNCWQSQYELTLNLYVAATESAYLNGEFEDMEQKAAKVLQSVQTILDKVKIYKIQINALTAQSQMLEAISLGQNALAQLGVEFSCEADEALTRIALQTLADQLQDKKIEELIDLPVMSDPHTIAAMQLLAILVSPIFLASPALLPLFCSTMVSLSLKFGNTPPSTIGYATYGIVLCSFLGEVERGYSFGRVALSLVDQLNAREYKSLTMLLFGGFLHHRQELLKATIPMMKEGYLAGIDTGDFLSAGYTINNYFFGNLYAGVALDDWQPEIESYCVALDLVNQSSAFCYWKIVQQTAQNLTNLVAQPDLLSGTAYDERVMFPKHHQDNQLSALASVYIEKLMLAYLFGNYTNALDYIAQANLYLMTVVGMIHTTVFHFYAGLTYVALCSEQTEMEKTKTLALAETHQNALAQLIQYAPMNYQHKVDLVEAEKCQVLGKNYEAGDWYDRAIAGAKANEYIQEEALANELAAKFYLDWGKEKVAQAYMQQAYYCYARWGAKAKTDDLETRYPQLLFPILQAQRDRSLLSETRLPPDRSSLSDRTIQTTRSSSSISESLDFATILKASQALSSQIKLEQLLCTLMQVVMENAGAKKAALLLLKDGNLAVEALANLTESVTLLSVPLETSESLPVTLIDYVKRTLKTVVLDDATAGTDFMADSYLMQQQPKSVLCAPILNQGKLIGLLYLENQLTIGAFTGDRTEVIQLLCAQAAISLENARLYQQSQDYAQQLERSLLDLQQAQLQTIQNEKMATLGNLVAGVAHEINNPIGFLTASVNNAEEYIQDLLAHIQCYQEHYPEPAPQVTDHAEDIDLEFLVEDLPKLIPSMKIASQRIREISTTLRTFSRADTAEKVACNLHEGIDSTLLILKYRLKANDKRPAIEIVKHYGNLPLVKCFFGQLNQVFMNIIANAIDALDAACVGRTFAELQAEPKQIMICTEMSIDLSTVVIRIEDNGPGISESVKLRIFDHLFTTKEVGKGTGLGLAIAKSIVEETHGGTLDVKSTLGQGTEFIIRIPILDKRAVETASDL